MSTLGQDTFTRANVASGLGTATDGHVWTQDSGTAGSNVTSNEGNVTGVATSGNTFLLGAVTSAPQNVSLRGKYSGTSDQIGVMARRTASNMYYRAGLRAGNFEIRLNNAGTVSLLVGAATTALSPNPFTFAVNTFYWIKFDLNGSTLQAKIWPDGNTEPASYQISVTDTTISAVGGFGIFALVSPNTDTATFDSFLATDGVSGVALAGTLAGVGTLAGTLSIIAVPLSATVAGVGTLAGTLSTSSSVSLSGTLAGVGTLTGTLSTSGSVSLSATLAGVGTLTGTLSTSSAAGGAPLSYAATILADSPVAYYRMNESSGVIAHDATSNHYDATLTGSFTLSQPGAIVGDTDTSILFNSASAALNLPYTLNITTFSALSLEFWINIASVWHHVAVTCNGPTTITYYDGSVISPGTAASIEISSIFSYAGSYLNGYLDEVAIYNYVLTSTQVLTHYHAANISQLKPYPRVIMADTPLGYYRLDEVSGLVANDISNGNNGTISSTGVSYNLPGALLPALGDTDTALLFDGTTGNIVLPSALSTNGLSGLTWELWLNLSNIAFTNLPTVIGSDTPSINSKGASIYFNSHASALNFVVGNGSMYAFATVTSAFAPSTWYHLVATYDGFFMVVYVNGISKATNSIAGPIGTTTNLTTIAHNPGASGDFLPATYDEVAIYPYALTPAQVLTHYQANVLSLLTTASAIYVNGNPIDAKPTFIASTSTSVGVYIQAGSLFEFIFPVYSSYTTNTLANGSIVLLTFPLPDGPVITAQVLLATQVIRGVFLVQATTLNTTIVATPRVLTPFF